MLEEKLSAWQRERRLWWAEGRSTVNILHIASPIFCILHLGQFIRPLVEAGNISTFPPLPLGLAYFWIPNQSSFGEYYFKYLLMMMTMAKNKEELSFFSEGGGCAVSAPWGLRSLLCWHKLSSSPNISQKMQKILLCHGKGVNLLRQIILKKIKGV